MDIIRFKLFDMDEIFDENEELFSELKDYNDTEEQQGSVYVVANYRIVIPEIHACFRYADWYTRNADVDEDDQDAWELQASVYLLYEEKEKDINQWISSCTNDIVYSVYDQCEIVGYPVDKISDLECYLEFDE